MMNSTIGICERAFEFTLGMSIRVSVVIVLVFIAQRALGYRISARWRYALSSLVVLALLLPVAPPSRLSLANLWRGKLWFPPAAGVEPVSPNAGASAPIVQRKPELRGLSGWQVCSLIWAGGFILLVGIAAQRHRRWRGLIFAGATVPKEVRELLQTAKNSMEVRRSIHMISVDRLAIPAVFGVRRVHLLIPAPLVRQLSPQELYLVFLHELAHIKRNDVVWNWILIATQFLHWFNPLVWFALRRFRADRELVCDAMVLKKIGAGERAGYGAVLLKLVEGFRVERRMCPGAVSVLGSYADLKRRIALIKKPGNANLVGNLGMLLLLGALGCSTLTDAKSPNADAKNKTVSVRIGPASSDRGRNIERIVIRRVGAAHVSEESIRAGIRSAVGYPVDSRTIDNDVRNLYATGSFYNVRVVQEPDGEGTQLVFVVEENARLAAVQFSGNTKFNDAQLRSKISSGIGGPLNERRLFGDSQKLQEFYREVGYPEAKVQYSYSTEADKGLSTVTFQISEGPRIQ